MRLLRYLIRRLLQILPVALILIVINFVLIRLAPGDVAIMLAGEDADAAYMAALRERFGLDLPLLDQLIAYLSHILRGDFGTSYRTGEPVLGLLIERVPATLLLAGTSLIIAAVLGIVIGAAVARRPGSVADTVVTALSTCLFSVPVFWLGLMLILLFAVRLQWLPSSGMVSIDSPQGGLGRVLDIARHMILPVAALSTFWLGQYIRLARSSVVEVLSESYMTTARTIGFSERYVLFRHGLRNALLPIVTVLGLEIGLLLTGAVLTETVFSWPGLGRFIYEAILARDTPVIMGAFIVMSFTVMLASLVADLAYASLDPRVGF